MERAKQSWVTSNSQYITTYSEIKRLHDVAERDMLDDQDTLKQFVEVGNMLRRRLTPLKLKVKEQTKQIDQLLSELQDQLSVLKRLEIDTEIKIRSCKGSCREVHFDIINLEEYMIWNKELDSLKNYQLSEESNIHYANLSLAPPNVTCTFYELFPLMQGKGLSLFEHIDQYILTLEEGEIEN
ncbi:fibrinogen alpha chain-like [Gastrophryne carolinensis]